MVSLKKHALTIRFNRRKLGTNWHWLQLLCSEEEIIQKAEDEYDIEKVVIPDSAWRAAHFWAPVLKVQYAISMTEFHND